MRLSNKTVLITGASTGIGRELAIQLAEQNNRLVLIARRAELLEELIQSLPAHQPPHLYFSCDVSDYEAVKNICQKLFTDHVKFDVLLFNAGIGGKFNVMNIDVEQFRCTYGVNIFGVVHFLKFLLPPMIERKSGLVAAVSSIAGYRGMPRSAAYCSSKAALSTFMESLRIDLWHSGVNVSLISPGFVKTPMTDKNDFYMPFLMSVEKAVKIILKGLEKEKSEIHFPYRMSLLAKAAKILPNKFYAKIMHDKK